MRHPECRCRQQIAWDAEQSAGRGKMQLAIRIDTAHQEQSSPDARIGGNNHCQSSPTSGGKLGNREREWSGPFFSSPAYTGNASTSSLLLPVVFFISHTTHLLPSTPFSLHTVQFAGLRGCQAATVSIVISISSSRCISITPIFCIPPFSSHHTVHCGLRRMDDG